MIVFSECAQSMTNRRQTFILLTNVCDLLSWIGRKHVWCTFSSSFGRHNALICKHQTWSLDCKIVHVNSSYILIMLNSNSIARGYQCFIRQYCARLSPQIISVTFWCMRWWCLRVSCTSRSTSVTLGSFASCKWCREKCKNTAQSTEHISLLIGFPWYWHVPNHRVVLST